MAGINHSAVDLGCGENKHEGAFGVDIVETAATDRVMDLEEFPWDLPSDTFETVYCIDILEHVGEPLRFLEEVYRVGVDGATVHIKTPHFTNSNAWVDPTHERPFSAFTFRDYITPDGEYAYYTDATFEPQSIRIGFIQSRTMPWNIFGRYLANRWPWWYEKTVLRSVFPAKSLRVRLRVVKDG